MSAELVRLYTQYRVQRTIIKARQREELEQELMPYAVALGHQFIAERKTNRVEDINAAIGLKNKTFFYKMKRYAEEAFKLPQPVPTPPPLEEVEAAVEEVLSPTYELGYIYSNRASEGNEVAEVAVEFLTGDARSFLLKIEDGFVTMPDEWLADTANHATYKQIIREIESAVS